MSGLPCTRRLTALTTRPTPPRRASGFTLVELLTVIVIIAILAAITMSISNVVMRNAANSRAWTQMTAIQTDLESFKTKYLDYPPMDNAKGIGSPYAEQNLIAALTGHARWVTDPNTGTYIWEIVPMGRKLNDGGTVPNGINEKYLWGTEFATLDDFKHDVDANTVSNVSDDAVLHDPWWDGTQYDNAYLYRYKTISDVLHPATRSWQANSFLLVSRGYDEKPSAPNDNFVWKTMNGHTDNSGFLVDDYGDPTGHPGLADNLVVGSFTQKP